MKGPHNISGRRVLDKGGIKGIGTIEKERIENSLCNAKVAQKGATAKVQISRAGGGGWGTN